MDRYIARQFMVNFLILFVACIGLIILVEMMGNAGKVIQSVGDRFIGCNESVRAANWQ